jgi:hypothetical protein
VKQRELSISLLALRISNILFLRTTGALIVYSFRKIENIAIKKNYIIQFNFGCSQSWRDIIYNLWIMLTVGCDYSLHYI